MMLQRYAPGKAKQCENHHLFTLFFLIIIKLEEQPDEIFKICITFDSDYYIFYDTLWLQFFFTTPFSVRFTADDSALR